MAIGALATTHEASQLCGTECHSLVLPSDDPGQGCSGTHFHALSFWLVQGSSERLQILPLLLEIQAGGTVSQSCSTVRQLCGFTLSVASNLEVISLQEQSFCMSDHHVDIMMATQMLLLLSCGHQPLLLAPATLPIVQSMIFAQISALCM